MYRVYGKYEELGVKQLKKDVINGTLEGNGYRSPYKSNWEAERDRVERELRLSQLSLRE
jgi:hypothetical protein